MVDPSLGQDGNNAQETAIRSAPKKAGRLSAPSVRSGTDSATWVMALIMLSLASGVFAAIALESASVMRITLIAIGAFHLAVGVAGSLTSGRGLYRSRHWNIVLVIVGTALLVGMPFADF